MIEQLLFLALGAFIGTFGTMLGVGGGFLLMPVLIWLYPNDNPEVLAATSLAVVFFNAFSGSIAYSRMKRIDFRSGVIFAAAALPGAVLGALSTAYIPRAIFDAVIGCLLLVAAFVLAVRPRVYKNGETHPQTGDRTVHLTDARGESYSFSFSLRRGVLISIVVGYISSILGIGGGIIHIPAMVQLLGFPVHIATATSHFVLAITAFGGTVTHAVSGNLSDSLLRILPLSIGVIVGAQAGARISQKLHGVWIVRALAVMLLFVGLRTLWPLIR